MIVRLRKLRMANSQFANPSIRAIRLIIGDNVITGRERKMFFCNYKRVSQGGTLIMSFSSNLIPERPLYLGGNWSHVAGAGGWFAAPAGRGKWTGRDCFDVESANFHLAWRPYFRHLHRRKWRLHLVHFESPRGLNTFSALLFASGRSIYSGALINAIMRTFSIHIKDLLTWILMGLDWFIMVFCPSGNEGLFFGEIAFRRPFSIFLSFLRNGEFSKGRFIRGRLKLEVTGGMLFEMML